MIVLSSILNLLFTSIFLIQFLEFKKKYKLVFVLFFIISLILFNMIGFYGGTFLQKNIVLVVNFIFLSLFFQDSFKYKLIIYFLSFFVVTISEFLSFYIVNFFSLFNPLNPQINIQLVIICQFMNYFFGFVMGYIIKKDIFPLNICLFFLPLLMTILFCLTHDFNQMIKDSDYSLLSLFLIFFIFDLIVIFVQIYIFLQTKTKSEKNLLLVREKYLKYHYELLFSQYKWNFLFLHDLLHECSNLKTLLSENKLNDLEIGINDLSDKTFQSFNNVYSNSFVVSNLLNAKESIAKEHNIHVTNVVSNEVVDGLDLLLQLDLFSTIIDFCFLWCCKSNITNKKIIIKSKIVKNTLLIQLLLTTTSDILSEKDFEMNLSKILKKPFKIFKEYDDLYHLAEISLFIFL